MHLRCLPTQFDLSYQRPGGGAAGSGGDLTHTGSGDGKGTQAYSIRGMCIDGDFKFKKRVKYFYIYSTLFQMEDYETKLTVYAEKIIKLTVDIEEMEKNPDAYNDADLEDTKVEIKQVEALIKELQLSITGSTTVFESLHIQVSPAAGCQCINQTDIMPIHRRTTCFRLDHSHGGDPEQAGEDLRQECGPGDASGVHQGAAATRGVRETPPGAFQPQYW